MAVGAATLAQPMHPVAGIRLGVAQAGIKKANRDDLVVIELAPDAQLAGVFTQNAFCAAPVTLAKQHMQQGSPRYLLINTGNANAGTGQQGLVDAQQSCQALAQLLQAQTEQVLPFSTGVIGEKLPVDKICAALPAAIADLDGDNWNRAATGIMTTDTRPKGASRQIEYQGNTITLTGISKGSGMIRPNMATMLGFIATDAAIAQPLLQQLLSEAAERSFNRISVDGDTSTNDACILMATGQSGVTVEEADQALFTSFSQALNELMHTLALAIVKDGEGATKLVTIAVEAARDRQEALDTAYTVAHSPLVKTALFASDANWGRILAAVGRAGIDQLDLNALQIYLGDVCIVEKGGRAASYTEAAGQQVMAQEEILIRICLNRGDVNEWVWTTDLSHEYVTINADYRS